MSQPMWQSLCLSSVMVASGLVLSSTALAVNLSPSPDSRDNITSSSLSGERGILQAQVTLEEFNPKETSQTPANEMPLAEAFNRAFFNSTGRFFESTGISGQLNTIFGWRTFPGSFPENQITSDGLVIQTIYSDALQQQAGDSKIFTRDLPNPFNTSLQENPNYLRIDPANAGGTVIERQPFFP